MFACVFGGSSVVVFWCGGNENSSSFRLDRREKEGKGVVCRVFMSG